MVARTFQKLVLRTTIMVSAWLALRHPKIHCFLFGSPDSEKGSLGQVIPLFQRQDFRQVGLQQPRRDWGGILIGIALVALLILVPLLLRPNPFQ
jgi:hypothetical protein